MQQLSAIDANFIYLEQGSNYSHISGVAIYDPSTAPGGKVRFKQIIDMVNERCSQVPMMRSTLRRVPLELDFPWWVAGEGFDPEFHVRHIALPAPGDWRQLCIQVARLHSRPLDRSRPMWEMYVIEGLDKLEGIPKGCFAIFTKVHHAAIDGASTVDLAAATHDFEPNAKARKKEQPTIEVDHEPSTLELLWKAQMSNLRKPSRVIDLVRHNAPKFLESRRRLRSGELKKAGAAPRTRFNEAVSPHRVFLSESFTLDDIRAIKNKVQGATVNDVAVALCGGALRHYLLDKNELPEETLIGLAPINIRNEGQKGSGGNQVSQMNVALRTDIADAGERLRAVQQGNAAAKELNKAVGARLMMDSSQLITPTLTAAAARVAHRFGVAQSVNPNVNTVVTNVPGLQVPLYFAGAKMLRSYGLGTAMDGMGLFHSITSYLGRLAFSVTSCRKMLPDPEVYAQCLQRAFEELKAAK